MIKQLDLTINCRETLGMEEHQGGTISKIQACGKLRKEDPICSSNKLQGNTQKEGKSTYRLTRVTLSTKCYVRTVSEFWLEQTNYKTINSNVGFNTVRYFKEWGNETETTFPKTEGNKNKQTNKTCPPIQRHDKKHPCLWLSSELNKQISSPFSCYPTAIALWQGMWTGLGYVPFTNHCKGQETATGMR